MADALICGVWAPHEPAAVAETMLLYGMRLPCKKSAQIEGLRVNTLLCFKMGFKCYENLAKLKESDLF